MHPRRRESLFINNNPIHWEFSIIHTKQMGNKLSEQNPCNRKREITFYEKKDDQNNLEMIKKTSRLSNILCISPFDCPPFLCIYGSHFALYQYLVSKYLNA